MVWFFGNNKKEDQNNNNIVARQNPQNNSQFTTHYSSYSSSRTCRSDPQDDQYMICKEKIYENGKQREVEERIHVDDNHFGNQFMGFPTGLFGNMFRGLDESSSIMQSRFQQLDKDFQQDFEKIAHSFMPFFAMIDPEAHKNFQSSSRHFQKYPSGEQNRNGKFENKQNYNRPKDSGYKSDKENNHYYYSSQDRDYQIRDL